MGFKLGKRSKRNLIGVHPDLVRVVKRAIQTTDVDFTVLEGVRSRKRQRQLFRSGASKTMNSRHLTGHAVDLGAYVGGSVRWDWPLYHKIARAMRDAAIIENIPIKWGGVWDRRLSGLCGIEGEVADYIVRQRQRGRKAFIDGPHFQLTRKAYPK